MNLHPSDIEIHVHLCEDGNINSKALIQALDTLESSLYASDRRDVEIAAKELGISAITRDACLERLRRYRHDRLIITDARPGSIEIIGIIAGISFYLLDKTLSETIVDAYKDTELHKEMKVFFKENIDDKALFISENLRRVLGNKKKDANVKTVGSSETQPNRIIIDMLGEPKAKRKMQIGSLGEELDK